MAAPEYYDAQPAFLKNTMNRTRWGWRFDTPPKYQEMVKGYYRMISGIDMVLGPDPGRARPPRPRREHGHRLHLGQRLFPGRAGLRRQMADVRAVDPGPARRVRSAGAPRKPRTGQAGPGPEHRPRTDPHGPGRGPHPLSGPGPQPETPSRQENAGLALGDLLRGALGPPGDPAERMRPDRALEIHPIPRASGVRGAVRSGGRSGREKEPGRRSRPRPRAGRAAGALRPDHPEPARGSSQVPMTQPGPASSARPASRRQGLVEEPGEHRIEVERRAASFIDAV
ncbi:MAG: hypothetical protein MZV63_59010 [Marinilabiliales bacterium]|nr:hypothetical protein [Marinilabiliales bacterium]